MRTFFIRTFEAGLGYGREVLAEICFGYDKEAEINKFIILRIILRRSFTYYLML